MTWSIIILQHETGMKWYKLKYLQFYTLLNNHFGWLFYRYFDRDYIPIKSIEGSSISVTEQLYTWLCNYILNWDINSASDCCANYSDEMNRSIIHERVRLQQILNESSISMWELTVVILKRTSLKVVSLFFSYSFQSVFPWLPQYARKKGKREGKEVEKKEKQPEIKTVVHLDTLLPTACMDLSPEF